MAASFAPVVGAASGLAESIVPGSTYTLQFTFTGDTSYPTGGYAFGIAQLQAALQAGMAIQYILVMSPLALISDSLGTPATTGYILSYDYINGKFQLFSGGTTPTEVASATNVSAAVGRFLVFYR